MLPWKALFVALHWLGVTVYAGSVLTFASLFVAERLLRARPGWGLDRRALWGAWTAWGPGLGLAMGALILGGLGTHWLEHGHLRWAGTGAIYQAKCLVFLVLWVSSFHLEIWTQEEARALTLAGDERALGAPLDRVVRQLVVNAALCLLLGGLAVVPAG